jgi:hypothetical protein
MTNVGEYYSEADDTEIIKTEYGEKVVTIKYNYWSNEQQECVTQRWHPPSSLDYAQYTLYEWLQQKAAECRALEEEGFIATGAHAEGAIIWTRSP